MSDPQPSGSRSPVKPRSPSQPRSPAKPAALASPLHQPTPSPRQPALANILNQDGPSSSSSSALARQLDEGDVTMEDDEDSDDQAGGDDGEEGDEEGEGDGEEGEGAEDGDSDDDDDDDDEDEDSDGDGAESEDLGSPDIVALDGPGGIPDLSLGAQVGVKSEPAEAGATGAAEPEVNELKPKKKRARRSPSSDEDIAAPPPPIPTIRVSWDLVPGETLEVSFTQRAIQAGYQLGQLGGLTEDADGDVTGGATTEAGEPLPDGIHMDEAAEMAEIARRLEAKYDKPKKGRVIRKRKIDYDLNDPFIDDSDLQIDAPTHVARPKQEGYFVHAGPLELMEEEPAKPKPRRPAVRSGGKSTVQISSLSERLLQRAAAEAGHGDGTQNSPIPVDSDEEQAAGPARPVIRPVRNSPSPEPTERELAYQLNRSLFKNAPREQKYLHPFDAFPDEVAHRLRALWRLSVKHEWNAATKGKFPDELKPALKLAGEAAYRHDLLCVTDKTEWFGGVDERWSERALVNALCGILPYNKLTLSKLLLKTCYRDYHAWLVACEREGLRRMKELADAEAPKHIERYEASLVEWQNQKGENGQPVVLEQTMATGDDGEGQGHGDKGPNKRFPLTEEMRAVFAQLLTNSLEQADINKKMDDWGQAIDGAKSDQSLRKELYKKIQEQCFPDGYMTGLTLSREMTRVKSTKKATAE